MGESYELSEPDFVTAGAVGPPGGRTFYIQAEQDGERLTLLAEKAQVRSLTQLAQELLTQLGVTVTPDDLEEQHQRLREPLTPVWRAGSMRLGLEEATERFVLEVEEWPGEEEPNEPGTASIWMSREQLAALAAYAAYAVEAGARENCRYCGRPIDAGGHVCPSMNGHGPLSV